MAEFQIVAQVAQPFAFVSRTARIAEMKTAVPAAIGEVMAAFSKAGVYPAGPPMAHYLSYDNDSTTFEIGFPAAEADRAGLSAAGLAIGQTCGGLAMVGTHVGPYEEAPKTYDAMIAQMQAAGHAPALDMWEGYESPPDTPPAEIRTNIVWPIAAAG